MESLSLSSEHRVTVAVKSRPCPFCHFHSQCYIEKCHYSFLTMCWRPGEKWVISRPASASGDRDVQQFNAEQTLGYAARSCNQSVLLRSRMLVSAVYCICKKIDITCTLLPNNMLLNVGVDSTLCHTLLKCNQRSINTFHLSQAECGETLMTNAYFKYSISRIN